MSELSVDCNFEALYLFVLDFEDRARKTIEFLRRAVKINIFQKML